MPFGFRPPCYFGTCLDGEAAGGALVGEVPESLEMIVWISGKSSNVVGFLSAVGELASGLLPGEPGVACGVVSGVGKGVFSAGLVG